MGKSKRKTRLSNAQVKRARSAKKNAAPKVPSVRVSRRARIPHNPNSWGTPIPTRRTNVLLLGVSYPCVRSMIKRHDTKFGCDIRKEMEYPNVESVEQTVELVRRDVLTEMDGRDLARCLALEAGNDTLAYCVSLEKAAAYGPRHLDTNFNRGPKFIEDIEAAWGKGVTFRQIILDYFWIPKGAWVQDHWSQKLFCETIPSLVSAELLDFSSGEFLEGEVNSALFEHSAAGRGGAVLYLPFCYHCVKEVVAHQKVLFKYFNISFLRKDELDEHALWAATNTIDKVTMQGYLGKKIAQEEEYCTFKHDEYRTATDEGHVTKQDISKVLMGIEDFDQVRMIKLKALEKHNPKLKDKDKTEAIMKEKGGFVGLLKKCKRGFDTTKQRAKVAQPCAPTRMPADVTARKTPAKGRRGKSSNGGRKSPALGAKAQQKRKAGAAAPKPTKKRRANAGSRLPSSASKSENPCDGANVGEVASIDDAASSRPGVDSAVGVTDAPEKVGASSGDNVMAAERSLAGGDAPSECSAVSTGAPLRDSVHETSSTSSDHSIDAMIDGADLPARKERTDDDSTEGCESEEDIRQAESEASEASDEIVDGPATTVPVPTSEMTTEAHVISDSGSSCESSSDAADSEDISVKDSFSHGRKLMGKDDAKSVDSEDILVNGSPTSQEQKPHGKEDTKADAADSEDTLVNGTFGKEKTTSRDDDAKVDVANSDVVGSEDLLGNDSPRQGQKQLGEEDSNAGLADPEVTLVEDSAGLEKKPQGKKVAKVAAASENTLANDSLSREKQLPGEDDAKAHATDPENTLAKGSFGQETTTLGDDDASSDAVDSEDTVSSDLGQQLPGDDNPKATVSPAPAKGQIFLQENAHVDKLIMAPSTPDNCTEVGQSSSPRTSERNTRRSKETANSDQFLPLRDSNTEGNIHSTRTQLKYPRSPSRDKKDPVTLCKLQQLSPSPNSPSRKSGRKNSIVSVLGSNVPASNHKHVPVDNSTRSVSCRQQICLEGSIDTVKCKAASHDQDEQNTKEEELERDSMYSWQFNTVQPRELAQETSRSGNMSCRNGVESNQERCSELAGNSLKRVDGTVFESHHNSSPRNSRYYDHWLSPRNSGNEASHVPNEPQTAVDRKTTSIPGDHRQALISVKTSSTTCIRYESSAGLSSGSKEVTTHSDAFEESASLYATPCESTIPTGAGLQQFVENQAAGMQSTTIPTGAGLQQFVENQAAGMQAHELFLSAQPSGTQGVSTPSVVTRGLEWSSQLPGNARSDSLVDSPPTYATTPNGSASTHTGLGLDQFNHAASMRTHESFLSAQRAEVAAPSVVTRGLDWSSQQARSDSLVGSPSTYATPNGLANTHTGVGCQHFLGNQGASLQAQGQFLSVQPTATQQVAAPSVITRRDLEWSSQRPGLDSTSGAPSTHATPPYGWTTTRNGAGLQPFVNNQAQGLSLSAHPTGTEVVSAHSAVTSGLQWLPQSLGMDSTNGALEMLYHQSNLPATTGIQPSTNAGLAVTQTQEQHRPSTFWTDPHYETPFLGEQFHSHQASFLSPLDPVPPSLPPALSPPHDDSLRFVSPSPETMYHISQEVQRLYNSL